MIENSHAHSVIHRQIAEIDRVPEVRRAEHVLQHMLDPVVCSTRKAAKLKFADDLQRLVGETKSRFVRFAMDSAVARPGGWK
jgi:hypothetical protein